MALDTPEWWSNSAHVIWRPPCGSLKTIWSEKINFNGNAELSFISGVIYVCWRFFTFLTLCKAYFSNQCEVSFLLLGYSLSLPCCLLLNCFTWISASVVMLLVGFFLLGLVFFLFCFQELNQMSLSHFCNRICCCNGLIKLVDINFIFGVVKLASSLNVLFLECKLCKMYACSLTCAV